MSTQTSRIPASEVHEIAGLMRPVLADLIALTLNGKQAHWHVQGPTFTQVHLQLDNLIDDARTYADDVAERVVALGDEVDGRPAAVAQATSLPEFPTGYLQADAVVTEIVRQLDVVIETARKGLDALGDVDPASQDVVIALLRGLEKHRWMFQAQTNS